MARRDSQVRITQVSSDGEMVVDFAWRDQFVMPPTWKPVAVHGIYGEYEYAGSEAAAQDHVTWKITVDRANGVIYGMF